MFISNNHINEPLPEIQLAKIDIWRLERDHDSSPKRCFDHFLTKVNIFR